MDTTQYKMSVDLIYKMADINELKDIQLLRMQIKRYRENPDLFYQSIDDCIDKCKELRQLVSKIVVDGFLNNFKKLNIRELSDILGLGYNYTYRLTVDRSRILGVGSTKAMAYKVFQISCHELIFGEKPTAVIPNHLGLIIDSFFTYAPPEVVKRITHSLEEAYIDSVFLDNDSTNKEQKNLAQADLLYKERFPTPLIMKERILEIAKNEFYTAPFITGRSIPLRFLPLYKKHLGYTMADFENARPGKKTDGGFLSYTFMSIAKNNSLDYFISEDYSTHSDIVYQTGESSVISMTGDTSRMILKYLLRISPEKRNEYLKKMATISMIYSNPVLKTAVDSTISI